MGILHLPSELLVEILSHLLPCELATASLLSRRLRDIAQPLLFRAPTLSTANRDWYSTTSSSLERFHRTLIAPGSQALCEDVRSLSLAWCRPLLGPLEPHTNPSPGECALPTAQPPPIIRWSGVRNNQVKLLLLRLIHLRTLHMTSSTRGYTVGNFIDEHYTNLPLASLPPAFHNLREFHHHSGSAELGISCEALMMLLLLPCIRSIDVDLNDTQGELPDPASTATSHVTTLRITQALYRTRWLAAILRVTAVLTHFSFTARRIIYCYRYKRIRSALELVRGSLQELCLNFERVLSSPDATPMEEGEEEEDEGVDGDSALSLVASLREWPRLVTVRCPLLMLREYAVDTGVPVLLSVLPVGIVELEIGDENYCLLREVVVEVVALVRRRGEVAPLLRRVAVVMAYGGPEYEVLREECRMAGVVLVEDLEKEW